MQSVSWKVADPRGTVRRVCCEMLLVCSRPRDTYRMACPVRTVDSHSHVWVPLVSHLWCLQQCAPGFGSKHPHARCSLILQLAERHINISIFTK